MLQGGWCLSQVLGVVMWNRWLMRNVGCVRVNEGRCSVGGLLMSAVCDMWES